MMYFLSIFSTFPFACKNSSCLRFSYFKHSVKSHPAKDDYCYCRREIYVFNKILLPSMLDRNAK